MNIQWYPGHMTKAIRAMMVDIKACDCLIYVLDARAPKSCLNLDFLSQIDKPVLFAINKEDLCDKNKVTPWLKSLKTDKNAAIMLNAASSGSAKRINSIISRMCEEKVQKFKQKGLNITLRAMVAGVPNSGKSTLINNLCGEARAKTGNRPAVTRGTQWVRVSPYLEVLDTPGTLPPKLDDEVAAKHLALIGSVRDEVVNTLQLANELIITLNAMDKSILSSRFKGDIANVSEVAKKRGYLLKGGEHDFERAAMSLIDDFRKGRLGAITLDNLLEN